MDESPRSLYETSLKRLSDAAESSRISDREYDAITTFLDAYDERIHTRQPPTSDDGTRDAHKQPRTLREYCSRLRTVAERLDCSLHDADANAINRLWDQMSTGRHPDVKDDGISKNTLNAYQTAAREFYGYHDFGPDRHTITTTPPERESVDERDMFTEDEIHAMRDAADHPRNKALLDMFLYTGQRIRAIQTLRVGDVALDDHGFYLNDDAGGLKGADGLRPLLTAEGSMREWLQYHPRSDDPDAYVFVPRQDAPTGTDDEPLSQYSINHVLKEIAARANVDKPANAHNFRHNFVTLAKREYDMDESDIKALIGHRPDSTVMETTYAHLSDEDHKRAAEKAFDVIDHDDEDDSPLTPTACPTCKEPQPSGAKACQRCGMVFTPDAHAALQVLEDGTLAGVRAADDDEEADAAEDFRAYLKNNPEEAAEIISRNL